MTSIVLFLLGVWIFSAIVIGIGVMRCSAEAERLREKIDRDAGVDLTGQGRGED